MTETTTAPLTPQERARATREANKAARAAARAARDAEQEKDKAATIKAMREIRDSETATPAQRIYAVAVLDNLLYNHFVPYGLKYSESAGASPSPAGYKSLPKDEGTA